MSENEFWIKFWLLAFGTLLGIITVLSLYNIFTSDNNTQKHYSIDYVKAMKEQGYTKKVVGCEKPIFDFVKDTSEAK